MFTWCLDKIVNTLTMVIARGGYKASSFAGVIEIENASHSAIRDCLECFVKEDGVTNADLAKLVSNRQTEKFDHLLPESLLEEGYSAKAFDVRGTINWLTEANRMDFLNPA